MIPPPSKRSSRKTSVMMTSTEDSPRGKWHIDVFKKKWQYTATSIKIVLGIMALELVLLAEDVAKDPESHI